MNPSVCEVIFRLTERFKYSAVEEDLPTEAQCTVSNETAGGFDGDFFNRHGEVKDKC
jgi:hypothetical protein